MLSDPLVVVYAETNKELARISAGENKSRYRLIDSSGAGYDMEVSHQDTKQGRHRASIRLTRNALSTNPLVTGQSIPSSTTVSATVDFPAIVTPYEAFQLGKALATFILANGERIATGEV